MVFGFLKKTFAKVVTTGGNLVTSGIEKITGKKYGRMAPKEFLARPTGKVLSTAAAIVSVPLIIKAAVVKAPAIIKAAIKKPITALVVGGIALTSPALIVKAGKGLVTGGMAVGEGYEKSLEKGEEYGISEALTVGGLAAAGIVTAAAIPTIIKKVKGLKTPPTQLIPEKPVGIEGEAPMLPETTTITTGKKPYKRRRAKITPSVKQYVKVNVITRATGIKQTHKYLNQSILA